MRTIFVILVALLCLLLGVDIALRAKELPNGWPPADVVTVVLSALSAMLAIVTIFLGIAAILGYFHIRELSVQTASAVAKKTAEEVATRATRVLSDQEEGQGGGDEYAQSAVAQSEVRPPGSGG
ncbi:hypothetical protein [Xanthobacter sp. KR7-225]|uniref:hypothetical protein n=1 Tax=Xanthobacter sp. KR7-225 TaxID=3156613 RepID=UPI0032B59043